jgi:KDO2-lipid IV(A) lauroyltransferase
MRRRVEPARRVLAFMLADFFFGHLPRKFSYFLMTTVGWIVATCFKGRVAGLVANLRQVFPEYDETQITDLMQRNAKNYGKFWVDLFKMPHLDLEYRRSLAVTEGQEYLDKVLAEGRGCLVVAIHMGGWEGCAALWGATQEYESALIAEVLEPPALWRRLLELRQSSGVTMIPLGRTAPREMLRRLKRNGIVAGAIDRDILGSGKPFKFFGRTARIPNGMLQVAQRAGCGVLPVICLREADDTYRLVGFEPVYIGPGESGIDAATEKLLRVFEACIRRYPDQWHVMEPIWAEAETEALGDAPMTTAVQVFAATRDRPAEEANVG